MKKPTTLPFINTIALFFMLVMNYLSNTKVLSENNIGNISAKYHTLITPAGYAFSIWGIIFLGLIGFVVFQWVQFAKGKETPEHEKAGFWFALSCIFNGFWTYIFLKEWILLSVLVILGLLFCLVKLLYVYRNATYNAPLGKIAFQWWPISLYIGWVILATVLNISCYLVSLGFNGGPLSASSWSAIVLIVAAIIYCALAIRRNVLVASLSGIWGLYGIIVASKGQSETVATWAWVAIAIITLVVLGHAAKSRKIMAKNK